MQRSGTLAMLLLLVAASASAQEVDDAPAVDDNAAAEVADSEAATVAEDEFDDADLDQQTYEENEDVFVPTEEIPADEPIPFPTNI